MPRQLTPIEIKSLLVKKGKQKYDYQSKNLKSKIIVKSTIFSEYAHRQHKKILY
jgi:hypothetical protein